MTALVTNAAMVLTAGGVICAAWAVAFTGAWRSGLAMALDLWMAAGLLRLTGEPAVTDLLVAASIVVVRRVVAVGLRAGDRTAA